LFDLERGGSCFDSRQLLLMLLLFVLLLLLMLSLYPLKWLYREFHKSSGSYGRSYLGIC
jgi:hypothetical protein